MKKFINILILMILSLTLVSWDMDSDIKPRNQLNTNWVSENPDIFFTVLEDEGYYLCLGTLKDSEKSYNIELDFDFGREVNIVDYDILQKNNFVYKTEDLMVRADCKFSEKKCIITVTESVIDSIKVNDKITFNRVEELPDWAKELDEELEWSRNKQSNEYPKATVFEPALQE